LKKLKICLAGLLMTAAMAVTGCTQIQNYTKVNKDGSGKVVSTIKISKEDALLRAGGTLSEEYLDSTLAESGYKIVNENGKDYYTISAEENRGKGELLKGVDGSTASKYNLYFLYSEVDGKELKQKLKDQFNYDSVKDTFSAIGVEIYDDDFSYEATFEFPAKVINTNGVRDITNPKKVTFDIDFNKMNVVFASTHKDVTLSNVKTFAKDLLKIADTKITKVKRSKKSIKLTLKKVKGVKYQYQISTKKNFSGASYKKSKKNTITIKKLKSGTKYYIRVRTVKKNTIGNMVYGSWKKKTVRTK